jgi:hypothetical protein
MKTFIRSSNIYFPGKESTQNLLLWICVKTHPIIGDGLKLFLIGKYNEKIFKTLMQVLAAQDSRKLKKTLASVVSHR